MGGLLWAARHYEKDGAPTTREGAVSPRAAPRGPGQLAGRAAPSVPGVAKKIKLRLYSVAGFPLSLISNSQIAAAQIPAAVRGARSASDLPLQGRYERRDGSLNDVFGRTIRDKIVLNIYVYYIYI